MNSQGDGNMTGQKSLPNQPIPHSYFNDKRNGIEVALPPCKNTQLLTKGSAFKFSLKAAPVNVFISTVNQNGNGMARL